MIFAIGTIWFWLLLTVALVLIIVSIENDWGGTGATITMLVTLGLLYFLGAKQVLEAVFSFMSEKPIASLVVILIYFVAGVLWSINKWYLRIQSVKEIVLENISNGHKDYTSSSHLDVSINKSRIISWMCYWPFSLLWTLLNDPIRKLFEYLFSRTKRIYESMSEKALKEINEAREKAKKT